MRDFFWPGRGSASPKQFNGGRSAGYRGRGVARCLAPLSAAVGVALVIFVAAANGSGSVEPYTTYENTVAADGPATQYRFDEAGGAVTLADSAGSRNATPTLVTLGGSGPFGGSKSGAFDGTGSYAAMPSTPLAAAAAFTVEAWVKWGGGASYNQHVFDLGSSTTKYLFLTPASSATSHPLRFEIRSANNKLFDVDATTLGANAWHYLAVTEDTSGTLRLYVDGGQVATNTGVTISPATLGATTNNWLGRSQSGADPLFSGSLSNVAFYTKALSASQILAHYNAAEFPVNTAPPTVVGTARDGETLTAAAGSWSGLSPMSFSEQWTRCDTSGVNCADVSGAAGSSYQVTPADVGSTLRVVVNASNSAGSGSATSAPTATVTAAPPNITTVPAISGTAQDGQTLTADHGAWSGTPPLSYAYQWRSCDGDGSNCTDIAGATAATYQLAPRDVGRTLRVDVTATNAAGSGSASSAPTAPVSALPPSNSTLPAIAGDAREDELLSATTGSWTGTPPLAHSYQWRRCDAAGVNCSDIPAANGATYTAGADAVGGTLRVVVTASNMGGSSSATSSATAVVAAADHTAPVFQLSGELYPDAGQWLTSGTKTLSVSAQDGDANNLGSGVESLEFDVDGNARDRVEQSCPSGNCPLNHDFSLDPGTLTDGAHTLSVIATDEAGNSSRQDWTVSVDDTEPAITASGTLTQLGNSGPSADSYDLSVDASDSGSLDQSSGAEHVIVFVDGQQVASQDQDCTLGGCSLGINFTYLTADYSAGSHVVTVLAADRAGNVATEVIPIAANYPIPLDKLFKQSTKTAPPPAVQPDAVVAERALVTDWLARGTGGIPVYSKDSASSPITFSTTLSASAASDPRFVTADGPMTSEQLFQHYTNPLHPGIYDPAPGPKAIEPNPIGTLPGDQQGLSIGTQANELATNSGVRGDWFTMAAPGSIGDVSDGLPDVKVIAHEGSRDVVETYHSDFRPSASADCSPNGYTCIRSPGEPGGPYSLYRVDPPPNCGSHCSFPSELGTAFGPRGSGYKATFHLDCVDYNAHPDCVDGDWPYLDEGNEFGYWPTVSPGLIRVYETSATAWPGYMGILKRSIYTLSDKHTYDPNTDGTIARIGAPKNPPSDEDELTGLLDGGFGISSSLSQLLTQQLHQEGNDTSCTLNASGVGIPVRGTTKAALIGFGTVTCDDSDGNPAEVASIVVTAKIGGTEEIKPCTDRASCTAPVEKLVEDRDPQQPTDYYMSATGQASVPVDPPETSTVIRVEPD